MYSYRTIPGGNGEASSEGGWRFGQSDIHGMGRLRAQKNFALTLVSQEYDLRNTQSLEESVRHSDVVYNLVGRMYPTKYV